MKFLLFLCVLIPYILSVEPETSWVRLDNYKEHNNYLSPDISHQKVTFYVALKQNTQGVEQLRRHILEELSNIDSIFYGSYMSIEEITALTQPSRDNVYEVLGWLHHVGIKDCEWVGDAIKCTAKIGAINNAFNVHMDLCYNKINKIFKFHSDRRYTIPDHLVQYIDFVDGISNPLPPAYRPKLHRMKSNKDGDDDIDSGGFSREVMTRLYHASSLIGDSDISIGAIEYMSTQGQGDGFSNKDLTNSQQGNGVPANPITQNHLIGTNSDFPDGESELDVQTMYWGVPNASLWYQAYNGWMYGWAVDFFNRQDIPQVVSISYGWSETQQCDIVPCENTTSQLYVSRSNIELMKLAARGITMVVASGDAGSPGRSNEACQSEFGPYGWSNINPDFPAGSPWVLSVGATYLVPGSESFNYTTPVCNDYLDQDISCANGTEERGVYFNKTNWTTGGAFTHWDVTPDWQASSVESYLASGVTLPQSQYFNSQGRAYPDVSAVGHNCLVNLRDGTGLGQWSYLDGTSCSAPVFAGIITQLNYFRKQQNKPPLGFVNPLMYKMAQEAPKTFNDVTEGTTQCTEFFCYYDDDYNCDQDFGFQAAPGWDPVGGLGTPNVQQMMMYLLNH